MIPILTSIIGIVARGTMAKAIAGGLGGAIATQTAPLLDTFFGGVVTGATPAVGDIGQLIGQVVIGGAIGFVLPYLAPKNAEKKS